MTKTPLYVCVSTAALIGASLLPWIDAAQAQRRSFETPHALDGVYAVDITTQQGDCDRAYHWWITVAGGHVTSAGDTPMEASGQINRRGIVDLAFRCDRTNTPGLSGDWAATYSLATRFIPSRKGVTRPMRDMR
jgi:hypothetical protein